MPGPGRARLGKLWRGAAAPIGSHAGLSHRAFAHAGSGVRPACHCGFPCSSPAASSSISASPMEAVSLKRRSSVGKGCSTARVVVDRRALQAEGAHALYIEGLSIRSESVAKMRDAGLACVSVNLPSRLCHRAKPMQRTRALRKMTIAASTAIQTNEGPQSRHIREPSKIEGGDYWIARIIKLVLGLATPDPSAGR